MASLSPTSSPGPSPRSKWRSEKPLAKGCQSGSKSSLEFRHANTMKCLRFVWITVSDCRKQTGPPDAGNNLRKSRFIVCYVKKYSTIGGVFQQPWPGVSWTRRRPWGRGCSQPSNSARRYSTRCDFTWLQPSLLTVLPRTGENRYLEKIMHKGFLQNAERRIYAMLHDHR